MNDPPNQNLNEFQDLDEMEPVDLDPHFERPVGNIPIVRGRRGVGPSVASPRLRIAGEGISIREVEANIRAERDQFIKGFAYELISMPNISKVKLTQEQKNAMKGKRAPSGKAMERVLQKTISLADIRSRHTLSTGITSSSGEISASKEFSYACKCYQDDFLQEYETTSNMYGTCKDLYKKATEAVANYEKVADINTALVNIMREEKVFGIPVAIESMEDALHKISLIVDSNDWLSDLSMRVNLVSTHVRQQMLHQLELRTRTLRAAMSQHQEVTTAVREIVKRRRATKTSFILDFLQEDCRAYVYAHLEWTEAIQLMKTCNTFHEDALLFRRIPSPRIRHVNISADCDGKNPAPFPHARYGTAGTVHSYVSTNIVVRLYVDFVQEKIWPAKKSFNTWEEMAVAAAGPDVKVDERPPHVAAEEDDTALVRPEVSNKGVKRRKYNNEGPREARDPTYEYKRLDSMLFFDDDLVYQADLVYSDTHLPVERCNIQGGLEFKATTARDKGCFSHRDISSTRPNAGRHHRNSRIAEAFGPALAHFKVIKLSSEVGNRKFCIRLRGTANRFGATFVLTHFSEPFYVVSKLAQHKKR